MSKADQLFETFANPDPTKYVVQRERKDGTVSTFTRHKVFTSPNPSRFETGKLRESDVQEAAEKNPDKLYNERDPVYEVQHQTPEHRVMVLMRAQGYGIKEIAAELGRSSINVSNVLRQPWARLQLTEEVNRAGRNEIVQLFRGAARNAAEVLEQIVDNPEARPADRIAAAREVLDRAFGKSTQPLAHSFSDADLSKMSDEDLAKIVLGQATETGTQ